MFDDLSTLSDLLNEKSDTLNSTISAFNEHLNRLRLGIEVWLDHIPIEERLHRQENRDGSFLWVCDGTILGYCEVENAWQLATKAATLVTRKGQGNEWREVINVHNIRPLLKTSREDRIKAAGLLPRVVEKIKSRAQKMITDIEAAEEVARSFAPISFDPIPLSAGHFRTVLRSIFEEATNASRNSVDVKAGDLHKRVGGYPSSNHRMRQCCTVMRQEMEPDSGDTVIDEPPSGQGATLTIRYTIPRP